MTKVITKAKARETDNFCRARAGLPYVYGGRFTLNPKDSCDCSALVLQTAAFIMGRPEWHTTRYGSTESFRLDHATVYNLGFKRLPAGGVNTLGFQPIMLVGLQHGGGGRFSHAACTLFYADTPGGEIKQSARGIDWESRGGNPGVHYYYGARAWNDSLFHDFWYLDARLDPTISGGDGADPARVLQDVMRYPNGQSPLTLDRYRELLPHIVAMAHDCGWTTVERLAMGFAQLGHESAGLYYKREIHDGSNYEWRCDDLGNCYEGDGRRFRGRGFIQLTGRANATGFSEWMYERGLAPTPTYFVDHPELMETDENACHVVTYYWTQARPQLNAAADARDLERATRLINGGLNGLDDRRTRYQRAQTLGDNLLALTVPAAPTDPWEELLMSTEKRPSTSPYRTTDAPIQTPLERLDAIDAMLHGERTETRALRGDPTDIGLVAATAAGRGLDKSPRAIRNATDVLVEIHATNPEAITNAIKKGS